MKTAQMASLVRRWFEEARQATGPLFPDGWFGGRIGECLFCLVDVQTLGELLVVHLSEDTTLSFVRPSRVYVQDSDLIFEGYDSATIRRKDYGDPTSPYFEDTYHYGQVRLVVPPPHPPIVITDEDAEHGDEVAIPPPAGKDASNRGKEQESKP